jgi:hypothetical protein
MPGANWADITRGQSSSAVTAYFTKEFRYETDPIGAKAAGMATEPAWGTPPYPAVFIQNGAIKKVLAHEVGHILGLHHPEDEGIIDQRDNLMSASGGFGTQLTPDQVTIMRSSTKLLQ